MQHDDRQVSGDGAGEHVGRALDDARVAAQRVLCVPARWRRCGLGGYRGQRLPRPLPDVGLLDAAVQVEAGLRYQRLHVLQGHRVHIGVGHARRFASLARQRG